MTVMAPEKIIPACPVGLIHGGGMGRFGLCAMELASILSGEIMDDTPTSVNPFIANLIRYANDKYVGTPGGRADEFWPLLPQVIGTGGKVYPVDFLAAQLGYPYNYATEHTVVVWYYGSLTPDYARIRSLIDHAVTAWHEFYERPIRHEFHPEERERLNAWLEKNQGNPLLNR
jgi:hypothetical protein